MIRTWLPIALLAPAIALAAPATVSHQGRMFDAAGSALTGSHSLKFTLYSSSAGGSSVWSETQDVAFDNGFFATALGESVELSSSVLDNDELWLAVSVDGGPELAGRTRVNAVPYALHAKSVEGGVVNASSIQVNGTTVIDSTGALQISVPYSQITGAPQASDTLGQLGCSAGQIAAFSGSAWECKNLEIDAGSIVSGTVPVARLPVGNSSGQVAAGDHAHEGVYAPVADVYTKAQVDAKVLAPGLGLEAAAGKMNISEYANGPLIPNARFELGNMTGWNQDSGAGAVAAVTDGQAGGFVYRNDPFTSAWISSNTRVAIRPGQDYKVSGSFRRTETVGNAGTFYLAVRLFDAGGNNIGGDGTWWYYPVNTALTGTQWHTYSVEFGPNFGKPFPANARSMTVGAILNYDNGNRNYQVTNLQLTATDPPTSRPVLGAWYPTTHQTGCSANTYCPLRLNGVQYNTYPGAFTLSSDGYTVTVNLAGYYMLDAHALVYQNGANVVTHFEVYRNGNRIQLSHNEYHDTAGWIRHDIHRPEYFAVGDQITAKVYQSAAQHSSHQAHQGPDYTRLSLTLLR